MKLTYLSHNHYAISDRTAGTLAREHATRHRLPRIGYEVDVPLPDGRMAVLARTTLTILDPVKNKRGWVWTVMPVLKAPLTPTEFYDHTTIHAAVATQTADILDARPKFGTPVPTNDSRCVRIVPHDLTEESITTAALAGRKVLCAEAMVATRERLATVNAATRRANFAALLAGADMETGVRSPIKANRAVRHSKESVKRGFRFTVDGLDGVYKISPLRRIA